MCLRNEKPSGREHKWLKPLRSSFHFVDCNWITNPGFGSRLLTADWGRRRMAQTACRQHCPWRVRWHLIGANGR
jgi:hypothetical protein